MAQLKDSIVSGNLRVTDTTLTDTLQVTTIKAPTASSGSTYGPGTNGQILKSNGTTTYWAADSNTDTKVNVTLSTTSKAYLLGTTTAPTSTARAVESVGDTNIWIQSSALHAAKYYGILGPVTNDTRPTSANVTATGKYGMSLMIATSTMTTGKPDGDGYIINYDWDSTLAVGSQLFTPDSSTRSMQWRAQSGSADWSDAKCAWITLLDSHNYTDYCSKVSFSRNLTTGTKVGTITIDGTETDLYCQTNTNTTYTFATGDAVGQLKVTPSGGTATNYNVNGISAGTASGTANHLAYYNSATSITSSGNLMYSVENSTASTPQSRTILHIFNINTVGNDATKLVGGVEGVLSYGDGGPQINFSTTGTIGGGQDSAIIWTDNDKAASGASWHFVSNQSDWNVISKRFHARTGISIGTDLPNTTYNLYVNGTTYHSNGITVGSTTSNVSPTLSIYTRTASTYNTTIKWSNGATWGTYGAEIGYHNIGGDTTNPGAICILPYQTTTQPWNGAVGLFIKKDHVYIDGVELSKSDHTHNYAGSSSAGGAATSANKLNTNAGATNRPVYFSGGVPVQCDTPSSGSWFKGVPLIGTTGVMEIGKYIDFHNSDASTADYDLRLQYTGTATGKIITLPGATGNVALLTKGSTNYWGLMDGDGATSGWIRTTTNGFIPGTNASLVNGGSGALGTLTWAFKNAYVAIINSTDIYAGTASSKTGTLTLYNAGGSGSVKLQATPQTTNGTYLLPACGSGAYTLSIGMVQIGGTGDSLVMSNVSGIPVGTLSFKIVFKSNAASPIYSMVEIPNIGDGADCGGLIQVGDYTDGQGSVRIIMKTVIIRVTAGTTTGTKTFTATVSPTQKISGSSVSEFTRNVIMYKIYACC